MRCRLFFVVSGSLGACAHKTLMRQKKRGKTQCVFPYCLLGFDGARGGVRGKTSEAQSILGFDGAPAAASEKKHTQCGLILAPARAEEESQAKRSQLHILEIEIQENSARISPQSQSLEMTLLGRGFLIPILEESTRANSSRHRYSIGNKIINAKNSAQTVTPNIRRILL